MSIKLKSPAVIWIKIFIAYLFSFSALNIIVIILKGFTNISIIKNYEIYSFAALLFVSLLLSLMSLSDYLYKKKAIRTDNKADDAQVIKNIMQKMKWKIVSEDDNSLVFKSPFLSIMWNEKIKVSFTDTELHILGQNVYVNNLISLARFSYAAYDIHYVE